MIDREQIRAVFLRNGFSVKDGQTDLKPYVYAAAEELLRLAAQQPAAVDEQGTPSSRWAENGTPDPHDKKYACERAALALGKMTDDELANAVYMHDHRGLDLAAILSGEPSSIALLTAAKERIRWLSRKLDAALAGGAQ